MVSKWVKVRYAVYAVLTAFRSMLISPVAERKHRVQTFLNLLRDSREDFARIVTLENGKTIKESRAEVDSALVEGSHHVNQIEAFYEGSGPAAFSDKTWMQYEPVGVAGII